MIFCDFSETSDCSDFNGKDFLVFFCQIVRRLMTLWQIILGFMFENLDFIDFVFTFVEMIIELFSFFIYD